MEKEENSEDKPQIVVREVTEKDDTQVSKGKIEEILFGTSQTGFVKGL